MCSAPKIDIPKPTAIRVGAPDNREAVEQGNLEARLRKRASGAAANILTSPLGLPAGTVRSLGATA